MPLLTRAGLLLSLLVLALPVHAAPSATTAIQAVMAARTARFNAQDVPGLMKLFSDDKDMFMFNVVPPQQYDRAAIEGDFTSVYRMFKVPPKLELTELKIHPGSGDLAYCTGVLRITGQRKDGKTTDLRMRMTTVLHKRKGQWLIVHEHVSVPVDTESGRAFLSGMPTGR